MGETEPYAVWPGAQEATVCYLAVTYGPACVPGLALTEAITAILPELDRLAALEER